MINHHFLIAGSATVGGTLLFLPLNLLCSALIPTNLNANINSNSRLHANSSPLSNNHFSFSNKNLAFQLGAVAENTITPEACQGNEGNDAGANYNNNRDIPASPAGIPPRLTVVAGPGTRITSVSNGVAVEQDFWKREFDQDLEDAFGSRGGSSGDTGFPDEIFHRDGEYSNVDDNGVFTEIRNESSDENESPQIIEEDGAANESTEEESTNNQEESSNSYEDDSAGTSKIRSAMAKSVLLHRAGIAGGSDRKSSRSNGRSSRARTHVDKSSRRGSGGAGAMGRVLGTVRTAAAAAAAEKKNSSGGISSGESNAVTKGDSTTNMTTKNSLASSSSWNQRVQSAVTDMLHQQDAAIQQEMMGIQQESTQSPPPPGTTSMGVLGEVIQDKLPSIPPLPGAYLVGGAYNGRHVQQTQSTNKPQVSIRSSIPHSHDDIHIANLRLSVFSRFDEEQQRVFRSRSLEVLNVRRRRGAVVLVAEVPKDEEDPTREENHGYHFPTEMQARVANGHHYGEVHVGHQASVSEEHGSSPSLTVTAVRGARITSVSSSVAIDVHHNNPGFATVGKENNEAERSLIIGSVECSHQEFRGTMLGNSRPKGSLMYITEVAVRPDTRRCGAGAALMKGVAEVASLRGVETIYLHVDVTNKAACAMYENCGYHYLNKREPIYAQFTASLNLHDGAMHGRTHYLLCKNLKRTTWLEDNDFL